MTSNKETMEYPYSYNGNLDHSQDPDRHLTAIGSDDPRVPRSSPSLIPAGPLHKEGQDDPFVSTKLSATALAFQPTARLATDHVPWRNNQDSAKHTFTSPGPADFLLKHIAEHNDMPKAKAPPSNEVVMVGRFTTDSGEYRSIKISGAQGNVVMPAVEVSLEALKKSKSLMGSSIRIEPIGSVVYLRIGSITDATMIHNTVKTDHKDLKVEYVSPKLFGQVVSPGTKYSDYEGQIMLTAVYPASVVGVAAREAFEQTLRDVLTVEGPLIAWKRASLPNAQICQLIVEYTDAAMAPRAVARCAEDSTLGSLRTTVTLYTPDILPKLRDTPELTPTRTSYDGANIANSFQSLSLRSMQTPQTAPYFGHNMANGSGFDFSASRNHIMVGDQMYTPYQPYSPTSISPLQGHRYGSMVSPPSYGIGSSNSYGHNALLLSSPNSAYGFDRVPQNLGNFYESPSHGSSGNRQNSYRSPNRDLSRRNHPHHSRRRSGNHASGPHNHVDINKIQQGSDVRTTVMLRNIPNKVTQQELKVILDQSSFGEYDFCYLRIDFSNDANVGYAFINFIDPLSIIAFVRARANQKWHRFKSDKVAEVSYATIQGRDCLIQKFRNSSVMLEPEHYRPKLFFTHNDPYGRVGEEDVFPASDNASKLKRSCENAEHVGLFAPNAGQQMRDEHRYRRSQFDRGTSLAEIEDSAFDNREGPYYLGRHQPNGQMNRYQY